jgi:hypothetical protein
MERIPPAMGEVVALANEVRQHWLSQGLLVSPVELDELSALQRSQPEGIPEEYLAFFRIAGLPANDDQDGFRFWLPKEVRVTRDVLGEAGYGTDGKDASVIIADYLQESFWYALWLTGPFAGCVSLALGSKDGKDPQPPLGTFVEFLLAYLGDDERLYG